jgi:hypothetical protein
MGETIPRCHCTLPLTVPPAHVRTWYTDRGPDPGPSVSNVVRWGDEPHMRRWVRRTDTDKWDQKGIMVDGFHEHDTPPSSWPDLGRCFIDRSVYVLLRTAQVSVTESSATPSER